MKHAARLVPLLLVLGAVSPAFADDPVVNYVRVSVDSDQQLNCNDLNVEIANVNRDIGLLESQDEELQGVASQGAQTFVPQSTNAGNVFEALGNTLGDAAVIDAEDSIPAVEASLSTARARVGYLESLQGSCGNNTPPPPPQAPQQQNAQTLQPTGSSPGGTVTGAWYLECCSRKYHMTVHLAQTGNGFSGIIDEDASAITGSVNGNLVTFHRVWGGGAGQQDYTLIWTGKNTMTGTFTGNRDTSVGTETTMTRQGTGSGKKRKRR